MVITGWETSAHPLVNASENLVGRAENRPGRVEFCIGYIRDYPFRASAKKNLVSHFPVCYHIPQIYVTEFFIENLHTN